MPEQKSAFDTPWFNSQDKNFFNHLNQTKTPNLVLTAETEDFDEELTRQWLEEGFNTVYVPMLKGGNDFVNRVHAAGDGFGAGGYYGIVGTYALSCPEIIHVLRSDATKSSYQPTATQATQCLKRTSNLTTPVCAPS